MKVVHIAFECAPIYKTGGLGDVVGSLPKAQAELGLETAVVMPGYTFIKRLRYLPRSKVPIYYIENKLFNDQLKKHQSRESAQAFASFCLGALEFLKSQGLQPDIIHCHDWHTGLIPLLLKKRQEPFFSHTKTILTLHNVSYQGKFLEQYLDKAEYVELLKFLGTGQKFSFLKMGIKYSDFLTTVSPSHASEVRTGQASFGLKQVIRAKKGKFIGILNGIDYQIWHPKTDAYITDNYDAKSALPGKKQNKVKLQTKLGLVKSADIPLFGFVARLTPQKGLELLLPFLKTIPRQRIQVVILGTGLHKYEQMLIQFKKEIDPLWYSVQVKFDEALAHQIYAASDFFLMPSKYEPCGLTQMIAMAYGSIPVAASVGGLKDTIKDGRTGYLFSPFTIETMLEVVEKAVDMWENESLYKQMVNRVMRQDFSWKKSAQRYQALYQRLKQI